MKKVFILTEKQYAIHPSRRLSRERFEMMVLYLITVPFIHTTLPLEQNTWPTWKDLPDVKLIKHEVLSSLTSV